MATGHRETEKRFSLKDELFNAPRVRRLAGELRAAHPAFRAGAFERAVLAGFPEQELLARVRGIRDQLRAFLPAGYRPALAVILKALPPPLDPAKTDDDFGEFIYAPYSDFVAAFGCVEEHLDASLAALREITMRFSAESALRPFLDAFPDRTLAAVDAWSRDPHYHVRRLASEGTRPLLPWAKRIALAPERALPILDRLHADPTRYVTRSVANHVNDLSKSDPARAIALLKGWRRAKRQEAKELDFIVRHALRTLVKKGDRAALALLGLGEARVKVRRFRLRRARVKVGEALAFSFDVTSLGRAAQEILLAYEIHFRKANGTLAPKSFKIGARRLAPRETVAVEKTHPIRPMSTRTLYTGAHAVELFVNGRGVGRKRFELV